MAYTPKEEVIQFEHLTPDGVEIYERTGECCRCGECCKDDPFDGSEGPAVVEGYCPLYRLLNGRGHCSNREHPYYLNGCNVWPTHPGQLEGKPSCTYRFKLLEIKSLPEE